MTTSTVIDLIDNVIHDWTMSDDAMRWNPDVAERAKVSEDIVSKWWFPSGPWTESTEPFDFTDFGEHFQPAGAAFAVSGRFTAVLNDMTFRRRIEVAKAAVDEVAAFWGVRAARLRRMHGVYPRRWRR